MRTTNDIPFFNVSTLSGNALLSGYPIEHIIPGREARAESGGVGAWATLETTISGARPATRYARQRASSELVLLYETSGGAIQRVTTANEGGTFSVAVTITSAGKFPALDLTPTGAEAAAWWVTGGAIKFRTFDALGSPITAEVTAVASGVAEDAIALTCRNDGSYVLAYHNTSGSIITLVSTNGGQAWA